MDVLRYWGAVLKRAFPEAARFTWSHFGWFIVAVGILTFVGYLAIGKKEEAKGIVVGSVVTAAAAVVLGLWVLVWRVVSIPVELDRALKATNATLSEELSGARSALKQQVDPTTRLFDIIDENMWSLDERFAGRQLGILPETARAMMERAAASGMFDVVSKEDAASSTTDWPLIEGDFRLTERGMEAWRRHRAERAREELAGVRSQSTIAP